MKLTVFNEGERPVRVVVDHDTEDDLTLPAGDELVLKGEVIEFFELDDEEQEEAGEQ
jgi:hypothetical protein